MAAPLKIIYAGSPQYAVPALEKLIESGKNVVAVITQPDKPVGRRQALTPTPVKLCAQKHGLPVFDFAKIRDHVAEIKELGADIMLTCAYGQLLTEQILNIFPKGVWNLHASIKHTRGRNAYGRHRNEDGAHPRHGRHSACKAV